MLISCNLGSTGNTGGPAADWMMEDGVYQHQLQHLPQYATSFGGSANGMNGADLYAQEYVKRITFIVCL